MNVKVACAELCGTGETRRWWELLDSAETCLKHHHRQSPASRYNGAVVAREIVLTLVTERFWCYSYHIDSPPREEIVSSAAGPATTPINIELGRPTPSKLTSALHSNYCATKGLPLLHPAHRLTAMAHERNFMVEIISQPPELPRPQLPNLNQQDNACDISIVNELIQSYFGSTCLTLSHF